MPPLVATVIMTSILRSFALEGALGVTDGHAEVLAWLARQFDMPELVLVR